MEETVKGQTTMNLLRIAVSAVASLTLVAALGSPSTSQEQRREFDFNRVGRLLKPDLTPQERARLGIGYLREEVARPTSTYEGSGGPIYHEYVLAQLVRGTAHSVQSQPAVDRALLWRELQTSAPREFQDMLALTLAFAGDPRVSDHVAAYLRNLKNASILRETAALALGEIQETRQIPLLVQVMLQDPQYVAKRTRNAFEVPIIVHKFRVREGARGALLRLEAKGIDIGDAARQARKEAVLEVAGPAATRR